MSGDPYQQEVRRFSLWYTGVSRIGSGIQKTLLASLGLTAGPGWWGWDTESSIRSGSRDAQRCSQKRNMFLHTVFKGTERSAKRTLCT